MGSLANHKPPVPKGDEWSVWSDNPMIGTWECEYAGPRTECLRYLDIATDENSSRLWDFKIVNPIHNQKEAR